MPTGSGGPCAPASFTYVCRGLIGISALNGRTKPFRKGERGTGWLLLFHVAPCPTTPSTSSASTTPRGPLNSHEHGGIPRQWNHTLRVEPLSARTCRYSDTIEIDAGRLTDAAARAVILIYRYRYRQRRWHRLVRKHLLPECPSYRN